MQPKQGHVQSVNRVEIWSVLTVVNKAIEQKNVVKMSRVMHVVKQDIISHTVEVSQGRGP